MEEKTYNRPSPKCGNACMAEVTTVGNGFNYKLKKIRDVADFGTLDEIILASCFLDKKRRGEKLQRQPRRQREMRL